VRPEVPGGKGGTPLLQILPKGLQVALPTRY
jgi:hypothetical protein